MPTLDDVPAIMLQRMQQRVGHDKRDIQALKPYRLLMDSWVISRCAVGRGFARSPPFREGVEAETFFFFFCQHIYLPALDRFEMG